MKKFAIIFFLIFFEVVCFVNIVISQEDQAYLDSLLKELKTAKEDTNKIQILSLIAEKYSSINSEKTIYYYKEGLALAEKLNYQADMAVNYFNLGSEYSTKGDDAQSLDYYLMSLKIYEDLNDNEGIGDCLNNIGIIYDNQGQYDEALEYYLKTIEIYGMLDEKEEKQGKVLGFNNIGLIYSQKGDFQPAMEYLFRSLNLARELDDKANISNCLNSIGEVHIMFEKYPEALDYLSKALVIAEEIESKEDIATNFLDIGIVYVKLGSYNLAIAYLKRSLQLFREIGFRTYTKNVYYSLSEAYELLNDKTKALEYYKLYIDMKDSLLNAEVFRKMSEMSTRYEMETKEKVIELLNKEKELRKAELNRQKIIRNSFIAGFALLLVFAFILYTRFRLIRKQKSIIQEKNTELEKLSIVASETDNAVIIASSDGEMEWANTAFTRITGYTLEEFKQVKGSSIIKASENPDIQEIINQCITQKKTAVYEASNTTKTGEKKWVQTTLTPILDEDGSLKKLIAIESDITKLKNAESEITKQRNNIISSINYAQNIQQAILVKEDEIRKHLPEFFIFLKPRDIGSGDFYWLTRPAPPPDLWCVTGQPSPVGRETQRSKNPLNPSAEEGGRQELRVSPSIKRRAGDVSFEEQHILDSTLDRGKTSKHENVIIAAIDCTGHGVPGAFMSMIGNTLLNEIVNEKHITKPAEILKYLHEGVVTSLQQRQDDIKARDGMDMAICSLTPSPSPKRQPGRMTGGGKTHHTSRQEQPYKGEGVPPHKSTPFGTGSYILQYAGAKNPLYIINPNLKKLPKDAIPFGLEGKIKKEIVKQKDLPARAGEDSGGVAGVVIKADTLSIGGRPLKKEKGTERTFTNHTITIEKGTTIYLFSDGYADQFNSKNKEKFGKKRFQQLLLDIYDLDMQEQKAALEKALEDWKGDYRQIDDILVIGIRV